MAVEETEISEQETPEQKAERIAAEHETQIADANRRAYESDLARARAEGEAAALKAAPAAAPQAAPQWTEEQWAAEAEKYGTSPQALKLQVAMNQQAERNAIAASKSEIDAAKREAAEARAEARSARASTAIYGVEEKFYKDNPALVSRKADVDEFLGMLPESVKADPKAYADALSKAKVYAVGKAKEAVGTRRGAGAPPRTAGRTQEAPPIPSELEDAAVDDIDTSDLENEGAVGLIKHLHANPGGIDYSTAKPLSDMTRDEAHKACERRDGRGVSIDESGEWLSGARKRTKELRDAGAK